jgi:hypothetical protein
MVAGLLALCVGAAIFLYARAPGLSRAGRLLFGTLRFLMLALLLLMFLQPSMSFVEHVNVPGKLLVLVDTSKSMGIRDTRKTDEELTEAALAAGKVSFDEAARRQPVFSEQDIRELTGLSRMDLVKGLLRKTGRDVLDRMSESVDIRYCSFADALEPLGRHRSMSADAFAGLEAEREATHLGTMVEEAVRRCDGPVAGVVLFTDGASNGGAGPLDVARKMGERGVPLFPVGVGLPRPDDVWLQSLMIQDVAFPGDTVTVNAEIRSHGYENRQTHLTVYVDGKRASRKSILLTGQPQFEPIRFDVERWSKGHLRVEVAVSPLPGEATDSNNRRERRVRIVDEKIKVLYIEGSARWEFRYLRAILKRDPRIRARFIMSGRSAQLTRLTEEYVSRFPEEPGKAFSYDLVILGDVPASFFTDEQLLRIEELVRDRGGSLLMLAGRRYAPVDYADTPIERMLPVRFEHGEKWKEAAANAHPVLTPEGKCSMVTMLEDSGDRNDAIWARMKPLGHIPSGIEARPAATVLAELSDPGTQLSRYPVIAWQRYGAGKSMFIATDRLWRLRFKTGDKYHWRLWSQGIQFLTLSRLLGQHRRIGLVTDRAVHREGENVRVRASVLNAAYEPLIAPFYQVQVERPGEAGGKPPTPLRLKPVPRRPGLYEGYFLPEAEGRYRVVAAPRDRPHAHDAEFHVSEVRRELATVGLDRAQLRNMAGVSGGRYLSIPELPALPEWIDRQRQPITVVRDMSVWDTWPMALGFVVLAGMEWFLRRKYSLS